MTTLYEAASGRYGSMNYKRCGNSGLLLPRVALGLWHNFGNEDSADESRKMIFTAFDNGITYFDLANNYGPPAGEAERRFGDIQNRHLAAYRDEMIIATKAGHAMWPGPYGDWGSRKSLMASIDQSLKRMKLTYVDIFYSHRYDPQTPLEETLTALIDIVRSGKALYIGLSKYPPDTFAEAAAFLAKAGYPPVIHQVRYSMLVREPEEKLFKVHEATGSGCVSFSPLAGGLLSSKYLQGIPQHSRAAGSSPFLTRETVEEKRGMMSALNRIASERGQSLSQMAISWQLYDDRICSVICGASAAYQVKENLLALEHTCFTPEELTAIDRILEGVYP